ncbi:MAG TPA: ABC transporter permease, partial [Treponemataceae bacterium]|nr:ABC transporter permease [Treponemataceae bacterium]
MINARSWVFFVSSRFGKADSRGRSAVTGTLSALGIALGVAALIVILSVMNGFQMGYIESILEVSSAHARLSEGTEADYARAAGLPGVRSLTVFTEAQALVEGRYGRQQGALLRAVDPDIAERDPLFAERARVENGRFDLRPGSIVLGCELARFLQVSVGDTVNVLAVSGTSETDLVPADGDLRVRGTVRTGYYEIDTSFAFVSRADGVRLLGP